MLVDGVVADTAGLLLTDLLPSGVEVNIVIDLSNLCESLDGFLASRIQIPAGELVAIVGGQAHTLQALPQAGADRHDVCLSLAFRAEDTAVTVVGNGSLIQLGIAIVVQIDDAVGISLQDSIGCQRITVQLSLGRNILIRLAAILRILGLLADQLGNGGTSSSPQIRNGDRTNFLGALTVLLQEMLVDGVVADTAGLLLTGLLPAGVEINIGIDHSNLCESLDGFRAGRIQVPAGERTTATDRLFCTPQAITQLGCESHNVYPFDSCRTKGTAVTVVGDGSLIDVGSSITAAPIGLRVPLVQIVVQVDLGVVLGQLLRSSRAGSERIIDILQLTCTIYLILIVICNFT